MSDTYNQGYLQQLSDCGYDSPTSQIWFLPPGHDARAYALDVAPNFEEVPGVDTGPQIFDGAPYFAHSSPMVDTVQPMQTNSCLPSYDQQQDYYQALQQAHDYALISGQQAVEPTWAGPVELEDAALELKNCPELQENQDIPHDLLLPFLHTVRLPPKTRGKGSRKGAHSYFCLWENCGKRVVRRDHALAHVASHVGSKPFKCEYCDRAFLRRADRKRHFRSCRPTRRQSSELSTASSGTSHGGGSVDTSTQSSGHASQSEQETFSTPMKAIPGQDLRY